MKNISTTEFEAEVLKSPLPVLLDFHTEQCGPCRALKPVLEEIERERAGRLVVVLVDASAAPDLASAHSVASVPALFLYQQGRCVRQRVGYSSKSALLQWIDRP